jgi:hypothetical protein
MAASFRVDVGPSKLSSASASPYRRPRNACCGRLTSRTFYYFLGEATTTSQLPFGKTLKVVNFLEGKLISTNAKDEKNRGEVEEKSGRK